MNGLEALFILIIGTAGLTIVYLLIMAGLLLLFESKPGHTFVEAFAELRYRSQAFKNEIVRSLKGA